MTDTKGIVARIPSRYGGKCHDCGRWINRGEMTYKIGTDGQTTQAGQGPGFWVCTECVEVSYL